jgi:hypothetical protein
VTLLSSGIPVPQALLIGGELKIHASGQSYSPDVEFFRGVLDPERRRAREEQCLPADPARSALARSLRTSDL